MQGPRRSRRLQAKRAQQRSPASLLDLPEDVIDLIAAAAGRPVRLVCRRLRAAVLLSRLRPLKPAALPMDALLAAATKPTLLRPLTSLDLSKLAYQAHGAALQDVVSSIVQQAATHCTTLQHLNLGSLPGFDLALLTTPATRLLHTLRSLTLLPRQGFHLPHDLAPLSLLTNLDDLSLHMGELHPYYDFHDGAPSLETIRQRLAPMLSLTQLTALCLQGSGWLRGTLPGPELLPICFPRLRHLDLLGCQLAWDSAECEHLAAHTSLTHLAVNHPCGGVLLEDDEEGLLVDVVSRTFFRRVANLPLLHTAKIRLGDDDSIDVLPELFRSAPPGPVDAMSSAAAAAGPPSLRSLALLLELGECNELCRITSALHGSAWALTHLSIYGGQEQGWTEMSAYGPQALEHLVAAAPALRSLALGCIYCSDGSTLAPLSALASSLTALTLAWMGNLGCSSVPAVLTRLTQLQKLDVDPGR